MSREARSVRDELSVNDADKVTLEASHRVLAALAGFTFPVEVFTRPWVVTDLDEGDGVYGSVQLTIAHPGSISIDRSCQKRPELEQSR